MSATNGSGHHPRRTRPLQVRRPPSAAGGAAVATDRHLAELRGAERTVDEIEDSQRRLRDRARRLLGVTGDAEGPPAPGDDPGGRGVGWYPLAALGALLAVDQLQTVAFAALGPEISRALGIGKGAVGSLVVLKTLALMAVSLPVAGYVARRGRRDTLARTAGHTWGVVTSAAAFAGSAGGLLGAFLGNGVASGAAQVVHTPLVYDAYAPGRRVRALSLHRIGASAGTIAAPIVVGVLAALGFTWRASILAVGLLSIVAALAAARLRDPGFGRWDELPLRRAVRDEAGDTPDDDVDAGLDLGVFEVVRRVMLITTVRRVLIATALIGMLLFPLQSFFFFFLDERWDMGPGPRSVVFAAVFALTVPSLVWFGRRGDTAFRQSPAELVSLTSKLLLGVLPALLVAVASPIWPLMFIAFAAVFSITVVIGPALTAITFAVVPPRMRPHVAALTGIFLAGVGGIGGVLLLNGIDRRFGIGGAIVSLAGPALIAALLLRKTAESAAGDLDRMIDEVVEHEEIQVLHRQGRHLPMLSCRHIDFAYGQLQVLFDVSFTVDDGEMVALLGTNGAGKSTLLRVISGLGLPSRGSVTFRGSDITYLDAERRLGLGITQIPGGKATFGPLSVVENLRVYGHSLGRDHKAVDAGIEATFSAFPRLDERRNQLASTLSGGEQQMLALGKAFILKPRLLLIDELSLGLAPKIVGELLEMVRQINATGTAVVLVEQSVNIALSLVDHAYFMEKGEMRFDGPAAQLLERRDLLRSVFLEGATKGLR